MPFSASGRKVIPVSEELFEYSQGSLLLIEGVKVKHFPVASENLTNNRPSLGNGAMYEGRPINKLQNGIILRGHSRPEIPEISKLS